MVCAQASKSHGGFVTGKRAFVRNRTPISAIWEKASVAPCQSGKSRSAGLAPPTGVLEI